MDGPSDLIQNVSLNRIMLVYHVGHEDIIEKERDCEPSTNLTTSYPGQFLLAFRHRKHVGLVWSHLIRRSTQTRQPLLRGALTMM